VSNANSHLDLFIWSPEPGASRINRTCTYDGMLKENGEIWTSNDGCGNCSCLDGKATCSAPVCPELRLCESIRKMPGLCCDLCEDIIKNPTDIPGPAEASFNWMPLAAGICAAIVLGVVAVLTIVCVKRRNPRPGSTKVRSVWKLFFCFGNCYEFTNLVLNFCKFVPFSDKWRRVFCLPPVGYQTAGTWAKRQMWVVA